MGGFLDFLANNYVYFLIAAGVLLFALIGLLVDLKKKRDEGVVPEEIVPDVESSIPEPPVIEEKAEAPVQEDFNPAPPMPVEETVVPDINNETVSQTQVFDDSPVVNIDTPSEPVKEEISQTDDTIEEFK